MLLPKFEEAILGKEIGEAVSFTLEPKDGYGEVIADAIVDLPKIYSWSTANWPKTSSSWVRRCR